METTVSPNEFAVKMINDFMVKYNHHYNQMVTVNHFSLEDGYFSPYHVGESIWTHTMMVMSHTLRQFSSIRFTEEEQQELILAVLLHDIGKPSTYDVAHDREKVTFYGHEQMSTVLSVDILTDYVARGFISKENMMNVLTLINQHTLFYNLDPQRMEGKTYNKLIAKIKFTHVRQLLFLRMVDMLGNINCKEEINPEDYDIDDFYTRIYHDKCDLLSEPGAVKPDVKKPIVTIMIGLPNSGKSHYLHNTHGPILSRDAIIEELYPDMSYNEAWKNADQKTIDDIFEQRLTELINKGGDFYIDKTNLTTKSRRKLTSRLRKKFYIDFIVVLTPFQTILQRNRERTGKTLEYNVIKRMAMTFTLPTAGEADMIYTMMGE